MSLRGGAVRGGRGAGAQRALPLRRLPTVFWRAGAGRGTVSADAFRWIRGRARVYASSEHTRRYFCEVCGAGLAYTNDVLLLGIVDIRLAALDDPEAFPPTDQLQIADALSWMTTAHMLTAHEAYPPTS